MPRSVVEGFQLVALLQDEKWPSGLAQSSCTREAWHARVFPLGFVWKGADRVMLLLHANYKNGALRIAD